MRQERKAKIVNTLTYCITVLPLGLRRHHHVGTEISTAISKKVSVYVYVCMRVPNIVDLLSSCFVLIWICSRGQHSGSSSDRSTHIHTHTHIHTTNRVFFKFFFLYLTYLYVFFVFCFFKRGQAPVTPIGGGKPPPNLPLLLDRYNS